MTARDVRGTLALRVYVRMRNSRNSHDHTLMWVWRVFDIENSRKYFNFKNSDSQKFGPAKFMCYTVFRMWCEWYPKTGNFTQWGEQSGPMQRCLAIILLHNYNAAFGHACFAAHWALPWMAGLIIYVCSAYITTHGTVLEEPFVPLEYRYLARHESFPPHPSVKWHCNGYKDECCQCSVV